MRIWERFVQPLCFRTVRRLRHDACPYGKLSKPIGDPASPRHGGQPRSIMSFGHDTGDSPRYHGSRPSGSTALTALQHRSAQDDTGECSHHKNPKAEALMTSAFVLLMIPLFPQPHMAKLRQNVQKNIPFPLENARGLCYNKIRNLCLEAFLCVKPKLYVPSDLQRRMRIP